MTGPCAVKIRDVRKVPIRIINSINNMTISTECTDILGLLNSNFVWRGKIQYTSPISVYYVSIIHRQIPQFIQ
jgi:hypothetical protein